jgi:hypothetical protein
MGLTKMIEHVLVGILDFMDATAHNAKHDKRKKYEAETKRGMNWSCPMNKLFLDQSNGIKCYRIVKIIPQALHRAQDHQSRNPE